MTRKRWIYALVLALAVGGAVTPALLAPRESAGSGMVEASGLYPSAGGLYPSASDRFGFGVNITYGQPVDFETARLGAGWYIDWQTHPAGEAARPAPFGLEHMQIVRISGDQVRRPDLATIAAAAAANPGQTWLIGNEPDCIWMDNSTPEQYARVYHRVYSTLKSADPTCKVAIGGIVQATPLRLQWLDAVRARYQALYGRPFPADLWNIHAHILREERGAWGCDIPPGIHAGSGMLWEIEDHDRQDLLIGQIVLFRQWMAGIGEREKPLIVSEYGILMPDSYGFDAARVQAYMRFTFDYFMSATDPELGYPADGNRLVQRWAWYSLNDRRFEGYTSWSHLFDPTTKEITELGLTFEEYVSPLYTPYVDLVPAALRVSPATPLSPDGGPVTVTLAALVRNAGNADVENVRVRFEVDGQATGQETIAVLPARSLVTVAIEWPGLAVGAHRAAVMVDPQGAIVESDEGNNRLERRLLVGDRRIYLPLCLEAQ